MAKHKNLFRPERRSLFERLLRAGLLLSMLIVIGAAAWLTYFGLTPVKIPREARTFEIEPGRSLHSVAAQFARSGLISDRRSFLLLARIMGAADDVKAGRYSAGSRATPYRLLDKIVRGEFAPVELRFIEGWTFAQLRNELNAHPSLKHDSRALSNAQILDHLGIEQESLEGLFFPDTYYFSAGYSDLALLEQAAARMQAKLQPLWDNRVPGLPVKTSYEALILASIVEKETGRSDERAMIAAVFVNRLKRGMRLQTDPTVIYGLGPNFDGNLRRRDLLADTRYNTYTRYGLPPTPIAMPGEGSIRATLNPAQNQVLYFVARGDGSHQFSVNLVEHNRAVSKFQLKR